MRFIVAFFAFVTFFTIGDLIAKADPAGDSIKRNVNSYLIQNGYANRLEEVHCRPIKTGFSCWSFSIDLNPGKPSYCARFTVTRKLTWPKGEKATRIVCPVT